MERTVHLALTPTGGTVVVGGQDVSRAVRGITLTQRAGQQPWITLDLCVETVTVEGVATLATTPATDDLLVAFGWTRPAADADGTSVTPP